MGGRGKRPQNELDLSNMPSVNKILKRKKKKKTLITCKEYRAGYRNNENEDSVLHENAGNFQTLPWPFLHVGFCFSRIFMTTFSSVNLKLVIRSFLKEQINILI